MNRTGVLCLMCGLLLLPLSAGADDKKERFADGPRVFSDVLARLSKDYLDVFTEDELYRAAVEGLLAAGGRCWDQLLSPSDLEGLHGDLSGEVVGVGIEIKADVATGLLLVGGVIEGSPAHKGGVTAGDQLLQLDGKPIQGKDMRDVLRRIRGVAGTTVALTLLHGSEVVTRTLKRDKLVLAPVGELDLPDGVALVTLRSFTEKTPALLEAILKGLAERSGQKSLRGIVLDVRNSPGGLFDAMVSCAGQLLPRGSVVTLLERRGGAVETIRTERAPLVKGVPILVLTNGKTSSGAELLAAALHDDVGARVVGSKTFGKWNVQRVDELANGWGLKFTTGRFRTPRNQVLDGKGLEPDLEIPLEDSDRVQRILDPAQRLGADSQLRAAVSLLRLTR